MLTVIFLDRRRPDPKSLTFNAKSAALLQEEQLDKKGSLVYVELGATGDTNLAGIYQIS